MIFLYVFEKKGIFDTDSPTVVSTSLLHILFTVNTVKTISTISAAAVYNERKEWKQRGKGSAVSLISVSWDRIDYDSGNNVGGSRQRLRQKDIYKRDE